MNEIDLKCSKELGAKITPKSWLSYPLCAFLAGLAGNMATTWPAWLATWTLALLVVGAPRVWTGRKLARADSQNAEYWLRINTLLMLIVVMIWNFYSIGAIWYYGNSLTSLCLLITSIGITAGSTTVLLSKLPLMTAYIVLMILPSAVVMHLVGGTYMGLLAGVFTVFVARAGKNNHRQYVQLLWANWQLAKMRVVERSQRELVAQVEERWNLALHGGGDGVFDWHSDDSLFLSARLKEMLSIPQEDPGFEDFLNVVDESERDDFQAKWMDCLEGKSDKLELEVRSAGRWYLIRGGTTVKDRDGTAVRLVGTCSDINDRKYLESQLSMARNLESMGELSAGLAHEINTPVQYLGDNVEFLQEALETLLQAYGSLSEQKELGEDVIEEVKYLQEELPECLEQSKHGLSHITRIVCAMRKFSHNSQGQRDLVDLNEIVKTSLTLSQNHWKYSSLVEEKLEELPPILAMRGELSQMVLNLIINAADAIEERRAEEPSHKGLIEISTIDRDDTIELCVRDNGIGIKAEHQEKVFGPFFTTKSVGKGTGQGLTICHSAVESHGGTIRFDSEPNKGTSFYVTLPKCA